MHAGQSPSWGCDAGELIGTCGYEHVEKGSQGEIGFDLSKAHWGKGYVAEALSAVIAYGFKHLKLLAVETDTHSHNSRARRVLERSGFAGGRWRGIRISTRLPSMAGNGSRSRVDVPAVRFADAVAEHRPDVLGMSALLTTTMLGMQDVIQELQCRGLRDNAKVLIGGLPVSKRFAEQIGADAYGTDAAQAVGLVRGLM